MDVDAIMRIFHELQNLSQFLEQQVAELPDSDAEKTVVLGMVKVMRRTAEELFPHDDEAKAEEEQVSMEVPKESARTICSCPLIVISFEGRKKRRGA